MDARDGRRWNARDRACLTVAATLVAAGFGAVLAGGDDGAEGRGVVREALGAGGEILETRTVPLPFLPDPSAPLPPQPRRSRSPERS
ncbi:MAG: hypothetical protein U0166_14490 [Acidobacteriota bacterium]